jgi:hypothetical protein
MPRVTIRDLLSKISVYAGAALAEAMDHSQITVKVAHRAVPKSGSIRSATLTKERDDEFR